MNKVIPPRKSSVLERAKTIEKSLLLRSQSAVDTTTSSPAMCPVSPPSTEESREKDKGFKSMRNKLEKELKKRLCSDRRVSEGYHSDKSPTNEPDNKAGNSDEEALPNCVSLDDEVIKIFCWFIIFLHSYKVNIV